MIRTRHQQASLWENLFAEEVAALWESWMGVVDEVLEDDELLAIFYEAHGRRHPRRRTLVGGLRKPLKTMADQVHSVVRQTKAGRSPPLRMHA